ncbi:MAG: ribonuclease HII [Acidobacteria bacterium]|nr:ribonuclease HII [Acidobacteriota bacterium]
MAFERQAREKGFVRIAGADEAGRGALFGPVFAAAVILPPERPIRGLNDSKLLTAAEREALSAEIRRHAVAWAVAAADAFEIDRRNILEASRLALRRAVEALDPPCDFVLADAIRLDWPGPQQAVVHGDARSRSIAAASILAKVARDECMARWDAVFPEYGLARHKGYPTPDHQAALERLGPTFLHRFSYAPVRAAVERAR